MAKNKPKDSFFISAKILIEANLEITANSLEEALEKSRELKIGEFVDVTAELMDSSLKITQVYEGYKETVL
jgi:hypothetical protein